MDSPEASNTHSRPATGSRHSFRNRKTRRRRITVALLLLAGFGAVFWYRMQPYHTISQAKLLLDSNPRQAESLLSDLVTSWGARFPEAQILWARALLRCGRSEDALGAFGQIPSPDQAGSEELLSLARESGSNNSLLQRLALEAIPATDRRRADAVEELMALNLQTGNLPGTLRLAEELSALKPASCRPWLVIGETQELLRELPKAATAFQKALSLQPEREERELALRSLVRILIYLGDRSKAREFQDQLESVCRSLTPADRINDARLMRLDGNMDEALESAQAILRTDNRNAEALELQATLQMDRGNYAAAEKDLLSLLSFQPWNKQAHYRLGLSLSKLGRSKEAAIHFVENRRLLQLSTRVLELQQKQQLNPGEQSELIEALEQLGMQSAAARLRQR